jgi:hypothetical protein
MEQIDIFGEARKKQSGTTKKKDEKEVVYVDGLEDTLLELENLKAQMSDLEAQLKSISDIIKNISKEKFVELYQKNKINPNTFYIKDGRGCVMVIPMDRYITIKDESRVDDLIEKYGEDSVTIDEKFYFNNDVLDRNMRVIQELISESKDISNDDKKNLLLPERKFSITKGFIDKLGRFGDEIQNVVDDIQPVISLKDCGGKMAEGGEVADDFIGFIYE